MGIKVDTQDVEDPRRIDEVDANTTYLGFSAPGTDESYQNWKIKKIVKTGSVTKFLYPNGDKDSICSWTDRTSYTYS